jgi:hypothetical protein
LAAFILAADANKTTGISPMTPFNHARWTRGLVLVALSAGFTMLACATPMASQPLVVAVRRGDCAGAVKLVNPVVASNDDQTAFLAGRMLDEGICVQKDPVAAALFFAGAANLGDQAAALEYATKLGLGVGAEQSYAHAGDICRKAGLDPQARLSDYSLGYACTLRGVTGELLRESLPAGAFTASSGAARLEFSPASAEMRVRATPTVALRTAVTGSNLGRPAVDAQQEIEKAWRHALAAVPKPDSAQLDNQAVELTLDLDMTLESGREGKLQTKSSTGQVFQGEIHPYIGGMH